MGFWPCKTDTTIAMLINSEFIRTYQNFDNFFVIKNVFSLRGKPINGGVVPVGDRN